MIKAVIFDSDGMITSGTRFSDAYIKEHKISINEMLPFFDGPFQECLLGKADLKKELKGGWLKKWQWNGTVEGFLTYWFSKGNKLNEKIFGTISQIHSKGIICLLATNQEKYRTNYLADKFGYEKIFDKIFSSADLGFKKDEIEFLDIIMDYLREKNPSIMPDEVLFWDDRAVHVENVRKYGMKAEIFIDTGPYIQRMKEWGIGLKI